MLGPHHKSAVLWLIEHRQLRGHITSPIPLHPPALVLYQPPLGNCLGQNYVVVLLLINPVRLFIITQRKKKKNKQSRLPVVWTERRVRGITLGSFPAHEIPQELFHRLQCLPLTGKGIHMAAWRTVEINMGEELITWLLFNSSRVRISIIGKAPTATIRPVQFHIVLVSDTNNP